MGDQSAQILYLEVHQLKIYDQWHLGDLHHEETLEVGGVKIRRISSLTAADAWHVEKGFRAVRMAQAFVWDREKGRELVIDSSVEVGGY